MSNISLTFNTQAEKEADSIGRRFMNSRDVLGDMGRFYKSDLKSKLRLHDDVSSHSRVDSVGKDAVASSNDIFFGSDYSKASLTDRNTLLAHEVAHTMQQSGEGGMSQSVSDGAFQGGNLKKRISSSGLYVPTIDSHGQEITKLERILAIPEIEPILKKVKKSGNKKGKALTTEDPIADYEGDEVDVPRTWARRILSSGVLGSIAYSFAKKDARYLKRNLIYRTLHGGMAALMSLGGLAAGGVSKLISKIGGGKADNPDKDSSGRELHPIMNKIARFSRGALGMARRNAVEGAAFTIGAALSPLGGMVLPGVLGGASSAIGSTVGGAISSGAQLVGTSIAPVIASTVGGAIGGAGVAHGLNFFGRTFGKIKNWFRKKKSGKIRPENDIVTRGDDEFKNSILELYNERLKDKESPGDPDMVINNSI